MQKLGEGGGEGLILSKGSRLVSGKYPDPEEPIGISKCRNPPYFRGRFLACEMIGVLSPVIVL